MLDPQLLWLTRMLAVTFTAGFPVSPAGLDVPRA